MFLNACPKNTYKTPLTLLAVCLSLTACVTVNVNFPEGAVQKATDDYVKELYRSKKSATNNTSSSDNDTSSATQSVFSNTLALAFSSLIPSAQAAGENEIFKISTPDIRAIQAEQGAIVDRVLPYKSAGILGENNKGLLELRETKPLLLKKTQNEITAKLKGKAKGDASPQAVMQQENSIRERLYQTTLSANGLEKGYEDRIRASFSRSFQAESPSGTWVQSPEGNWSRKR